MAGYFITNGAEESEASRFEVETLEDGRYRLVTPEGREVLVDAYAPETGRLQMIVDGQSYDAAVQEEDGAQVVQLRGESHSVEVLNERQKRMSAAGVGSRGAGGPDLVSPMAGKIVAVTCAEGDEVEEGDCVVIVEAMKMENDLKAHISGTIGTVHVAEGAAVEVGDVLISIE
jgi:biotin carboxyl carrier protein